MIQRIQSIFLFLAAITTGLLFLDIFNFGTTPSALSEATILSDGDMDVFDFPALMGLAGLISVVLLAAIFLFKNRPLQSNVVKVGLVLSLVFVGMIGYYFGTTSSDAEALNASLSVSIGWASPFISMVLALLALRGISKDDKLVKSMDRLR